jgi:His-Xaa-Ser system protein HxsD
MSGAGLTQPIDRAQFTVLVDSSIISKDALLKTCYWFSRDFHHEITGLGEGRIQVRLSAKESAKPEVIDSARDEFLNTAIDFELRSVIEAKTSSVRDLILAKAFAESGVLEAQPEGIFADAVEEHNPDGLFKILNSGQF